MKTKYIVFGLLLSLTAIQTQAQNVDSSKQTDSKMHYEFSVGGKIGGTSPVPLPAEIRKIKSYSPVYPFFASARATYSFDKKWGITSGLTFEGRAMNTRADVKGYKTSFNASGDPSQNVKGYYTGEITTEVHNMYLTLPVLASYNLSERWTLQAGPYLSYAVKKHFSGDATNGYIRNTTPTGERVEISSASYDFKDNVRNWDLGASVGGQYHFGQKYFAMAQFDYGFSNIMQTGFETISFGMHNIFLNLGVGIRL